MPYRNMSLDELAQHIGMDAREVRRLAERGTLPGHQIGGEWRFNSAQLLEWLQREMHSLDAEHIRNLERAMTDDDGAAIIAPFLAVEAIDLNLRAASRPSLLRELAALAGRTGLLYDVGALVTALEDRETASSTALPGGIAFPHPRRPLAYATAEPLLCVARVPAGLHFGAPDKRLTDIFILLCSHDERGHLRTLARLALMFRTDLAAGLRLCQTPEEALALILKTEQTVAH